MSRTGLMLTTPGGSLFWHPCADAKTGFAEMNSVAFTYGKAWGHPESRLEFGTDDGKGVFTPAETVKTGWAAAKAAPAPETKP